MAFFNPPFVVGYVFPKDLHGSGGNHANPPWNPLRESIRGLQKALGVHRVTSSTGIEQTHLAALGKAMGTKAGNCVLAHEYDIIFRSIYSWIVWSLLYLFIRVC